MMFARQTLDLAVYHWLEDSMAAQDCDALQAILETDTSDIRRLPANDFADRQTASPPTQKGDWMDE